MCDFSEVEVKWKVLASIPNGKDHVSSFVLRALSKLEGLAVNLNVWVLSSCHHLHFQVAMLDPELVIFIELDDCEGGIVLGLNVESTLAGSCLGHAQGVSAHGPVSSRFCSARVFCARYCIFDLVRKPTLFIVLLCSAYELYWNLLVGSNNTLERLSCKYPVSELFANFSRRYEAIILVQVVFVQVSEALQELEFERSWLWAIIDQKGRIFSSLAHVNSTKVQGALLTTPLLKDYRQMLLHAGCRNFDHLACLLALDIDLYLLGNHVSRVCNQSNLDPYNLVWLNTKIGRLQDDSGLSLGFFLKIHVSGDAALILEFHLFNLLLAHRNELEVDKRLKLDVWGWHERVKV